MRFLRWRRRGIWVSHSPGLGVCGDGVGGGLCAGIVEVVHQGGGDDEAFVGLEVFRGFGEAGVGEILRGIVGNVETVA